MSDVAEGRCPYCNGTGRLPEKVIQRIEYERDQAAVRLHKVGRLWGSIADVFTFSRKKTTTLESLRYRIKTAYSAMGGDLTLAERVGYRTEGD